MNPTLLFAVDPNTEEVIVSSSTQGSRTIDSIERIHRKDNEMLYHAVNTLTCITKDADFDLAIFKAMDKVCQLMYAKYRKVS